MENRTGETSFQTDKSESSQFSTNLCPDKFNRFRCIKLYIVAKVCILAHLVIKLTIFHSFIANVNMDC